MRPSTIETREFGSQQVPVLRRPEWPRAPSQPYRKTYRLKPGESWRDAETTDQQRERYVLDENGDAVPVGAMIARELKAEGAVEAGFVELWGGVVIVDENLISVSLDDQLGQIVRQVSATLGGKMRGFPDAIGTFPDGRIAFREAKSVAGKDRINKQQHVVADVLRDTFGSRADIALVFWDFE